MLNVWSYPNQKLYKALYLAKLVQKLELLHQFYLDSQINLIVCMVVLILNGLSDAERRGKAFPTGGWEREIIFRQLLGF